jgi:O-antigen ligase
LFRIGYLAGGALIANAVVLTQSRGALVGIAAAGAGALVVADRRFRKYILLLLPIVALGGYRLTDEKFRERMTTIVADEGERDASADNRLILWRGAWEMFKDHPLGVGVGNFYSAIGSYRYELAGRDTHSTYMRCLSELGVFGMAALLALFVNAFRTLRWCQRAAAELPDGRELVHTAIGLQLALIAFATCGLTITMTYCEELFVFLLLPVCCCRAVLQAQRELSNSPPAVCGIAG